MYITIFAVKTSEHTNTVKVKQTTILFLHHSKQRHQYGLGLKSFLLTCCEFVLVTLSWASE